MLLALTQDFKAPSSFSASIYKKTPKKQSFHLKAATLRCLTIYGMCCTCTLFHFCLSILSTYPNKSTNTNKPTTVIYSFVSLFLCQELMQGQRGLAWRGDDSHPEGLKTYTVYIQSTYIHTCTGNKVVCEENQDLRAVRSENSECVVTGDVWNSASVKIWSSPGKILLESSRKSINCNCNHHTDTHNLVYDKQSRQRPQSLESIPPPHSDPSIRTMWGPWFQHDTRTRAPSSS